MELGAAASSLSGPMAKLQAGYRLLPSVGVYGEAAWAPGETRVGAGVRVVF